MYMATIPIYQMNYPRQREALRDEAGVLAWLEAIAAQGYSLTQRSEGFLPRWIEGLRTNTLSGGLSAPAREAALAFCRGERERL
jgi:hypothetical protein